MNHPWTTSASSERRSDEFRLLVKVARLYYVEGVRQRTIAAELGLSPSRVSTLIRQARESGLVEIRVHDPNESLSEMENELQAAYGLRDVVVVPGPFPPGPSVINKLGFRAAPYLQRLLTQDDVVGISGGRTLYAMAASGAFNVISKPVVVPISGGVTAAEFHYTANGVAALLAEALGGTYHQVPYPAFVDSPATRDAILQDASAREPLELAQQASVVIVGIGTLDSPILTLPHIGQRDIDELRRLGVRCEIAGHFLDGEGQLCAPQFRRRLIGLDFDFLRRIPRVIAVAGGEGKEVAIRAALLSQVIDVLITDEFTARELLKTRRGVR